MSPGRFHLILDAVMIVSGASMLWDAFR